MRRRRRGSLRRLFRSSTSYIVASMIASITSCSGYLLGSSKILSGAIHGVVATLPLIVLPSTLVVVLRSSHSLFVSFWLQRPIAPRKSLPSLSSQIEM